MQQGVLTDGHLFKDHLVQGFEQPSFLYIRPQAIPMGKIQQSPPLLYVLRYHPVRRIDHIEPKQLRLIGMTVVTGALQYRLHFRRRLEVTCHRWIIQLWPDELDQYKTNWNH